MPMLLDLDTLLELYPDPDGRRQFLQRAEEILRSDRLALQDALTSHSYGPAADLAHRLQGTVAFLTGDPERAAAVIGPLERMIRQHRLADTCALQAEALNHLIALESAIAQCIDPD